MEVRPLFSCSLGPTLCMCVFVCMCVRAYTRKEGERQSSLSYFLSVFKFSYFIEDSLFLQQFTPCFQTTAQLSLTY